MVRRHLFIIFLLFINLSAFAQFVSDESIIQKFSSLKSNAPADNNYILIQIDKGAPINLRNKIRLGSVRQLSDNIFVTEKEKLSLTAPHQSFFKQYNLSNNY